MPSRHHNRESHHRDRSTSRHRNRSRRRESSQHRPSPRLVIRPPPAGPLDLDPDRLRERFEHRHATSPRTPRMPFTNLAMAASPATPMLSPELANAYGYGTMAPLSPSAPLYTHYSPGSAPVPASPARSHHSHHSQPRPRTPLFTEAQMWEHLSNELSPAYDSILSVIHREFAIPPNLQPVSVDYRLVATDLDPATHYQTWHQQKGALWRATRDRAPILSVTLHVWMPPKGPAPPSSRSHRGSSQSDRIFADAGARAHRALTTGGPSSMLSLSLAAYQPPLHGLPFRKSGDLVHSTLELQEGAADVTMVSMPLSLVYLPRQNDRGELVYERFRTEAVDARARLGKWAQRWHVDLRRIMGDEAYVRGGYSIV